MTPTETVALLTEEYGTWCADQGLKCMDAMELIHEYELTPEQSTWIHDFIKRWDGMWNDLDARYNSSSTRWSTTSAFEMDLESAKRVKEAMK